MDNRRDFTRAMASGFFVAFGRRFDSRPARHRCYRVYLQFVCSPRLLGLAIEPEQLDTGFQVEPFPVNGDEQSRAAPRPDNDSNSGLYGKELTDEPIVIGKIKTPVFGIPN